jgi:lactate 2-monooxygenase
MSADTGPVLPSFGRAAQSAIYLAGLAGRKPRIPTGWLELEEAARQRMSREAFAYVAGSAGLEETERSNRRAFDRWQIVPRVLRDVSHRDLSIELLGVRRPTPFILSPIGVLDLAHPDADSAAARAAAAQGIPAVLSNQASRPMETVGRSMDAVAQGGVAARWFQLYWSSSSELVASLVSRAEASGCEAIVVTLDTHVLGWRPRDLTLGYLPFSRGRGIAQYTSDPVFMRLVRQRVASAASASGSQRSAGSRRPPLTPQLIRSLVEITRNHPGRFSDNLRSPVPRAAIETFLEYFANPALTWPDLAFLRQHTALPILLKGILHPDDARRAIDAGVDGIVVSNHGGRQIDGAVPTIGALPQIVEAVSGRIPIVLDSGVRGGADAFKALALGATAVGIGRPYVYGLAVGGEEGVAEVLRNLTAELDITMGLAGYSSATSIDTDALRLADR